MTNTVEFQKLHFIDRMEVQHMLDYLMDKAAVERAATVKDYSMAAFLLFNEDSEEYGWTEETILNARIRRDGKGFYLDLPDPIKL